MKHGDKLTVNNIREGLRIKIAIPRYWAETPYHKPYSKGAYCWVKGKINKICNKCIIINTKYNYGYCCTREFSSNMWCSPNKNGEFKNIYIQLK